MGAKKIAPEELGAGCPEPWLFGAYPVHLTTCLSTAGDEKIYTLCGAALKWFSFSGYPVSVFGWVFQGFSWLGDVSYPFKK